MEFVAPYVLYGSLRAKANGLLDAHVSGYRRLLEALRDDRYDFGTALELETVQPETLPILAGSEA